MLRDVCFAVLPIRPGGAVHRVAFCFSPAEDGVLIGPPRQLIELLQLLPQSAHRANHSRIAAGQRGLKQKGVLQREPPRSSTEQRPHPLLILAKAGDEGMLHEVPVLLYGGRNLLSVDMTGGHQQHGAESVPVRLVGVVGLFVVLRPGGAGRLARLGDGR